jgi:thiamine-monophosphate kinase
VANGVADVSDGLIADIGHVCRASAVTATVKSAKVPLSAAGAAVISQNPELLLVALTGGDDYELVFTAPAEAESALDTISLELDLPLTRIGRVTPANLETERGKVHLVDPDGRPIELDFFGYRHF